MNGPNFSVVDAVPPRMLFDKVRRLEGDLGAAAARGEALEAELNASEELRALLLRAIGKLRKEVTALSGRGRMNDFRSENNRLR